MSPEVYRKSVFCADLEIGERIREVFCLSKVERRSKSDGGAFLRLSLYDRSGEVAAVAWDEVDALLDVLVEGGYARIEGDVGEYRGETQVKVTGAEAVEQRIDPAEYLPEGPVPGRESMAAIRALVDSMEDAWLKRLLDACLDDPDLAADFAASPAAKRNHHAYVGGLAEHTRSVMEMCARAADHYPGVDRDLLLAGAFFHDVGKTVELAVEPGFPYTERGELLGHIPIGYAMVRERAKAIEGFPEERLTDLGHLVLSHQGELEWGSPVVPRTLEAIVLHFIDNLDSKVTTARHHLAEVESGRTGWVNALGRTLFRRGPSGESESAPTEGEEPAPTASDDAPPEPPARTGGGPDERPASGPRPTSEPESPSLFDEIPDR
ncbi:MAG: HD domain-containing protein [Gemmatimonadota bacterium]|nr:HD domain-containing protein [Gemmatimonadota bacterium]